MGTTQTQPHVDSKEDQAAQQVLLSRARRSLAVLGKSYIKRASGRYVDLSPVDESK